MKRKIKMSKLRMVIREAIKRSLVEAEAGKKRKGPVERMKGWQPPDNMRTGSSATSWHSEDSWDFDGGDEGLMDHDLVETDDLEEDEHE